MTSELFAFDTWETSFLPMAVQLALATLSVQLPICPFPHFSNQTSSKLPVQSTFEVVFLVQTVPSAVPESVDDDDEELESPTS